MLGSDWGVLLDALGTMDVYHTREEAEKHTAWSEGVNPLVRIDYTIVDFGTEDPKEYNGKPASSPYVPYLDAN